MDTLHSRAARHSRRSTTPGLCIPLAQRTPAFEGFYHVAQFYERLDRYRKSKVVPASGRPFLQQLEVGDREWYETFLEEAKFITSIGFGIWTSQ